MIAGPLVTQIIGLVLLADLVCDTIRPLVAPVITVIGASSDVINMAIREALLQLSVSFKGEGPDYLVLDPFTRIRVRFRKRLGTAEVRISPYRRKKLLDEISTYLANKLDLRQEDGGAPHGYLEFIIVGVALMAITFVRLATLLI